jgi:hypothetical protein
MSLFGFHQMKKIFIIVAIAIVSAGCSSSKLGDYSDRGQAQITIALDRIDGRNYPAGNVIYRAQKKLKQLGYNPGPLDGVWGSKTQNAIRKFQQDNGLSATGRLDDETSRQLLHIAGGGQEAEKGSAGLQQQYALMTAQEARHLIERHIQNKDIHLETNPYFRKHLKPSDSGITTDVFQGVRFDNKNYLVFALCEPAYRMVTPAEDLPDRLAKLKIDIPDDDLSVTFNGVFYSTVNLEIKSNPVFLYTDQGGFIQNDRIPKGGHQWLIGDFGMRLDNTFIFFQNPFKKNSLEFWRSQPNIFMIKLSLPREKGILLNLHRQ